jgi:hypothetical protein
VIKPTNTKSPYQANPCGSWSYCNAAFCPAVQQGFHQPPGPEAIGDEVCIKTGPAYAKAFNKDNADLNSGAAMELITKRYDKQMAGKLSA